MGPLVNHLTLHSLSNINDVKYLTVQRSPQ